LRPSLFVAVGVWGGGERVVGRCSRVSRYSRIGGGRRVGGGGDRCPRGSRYSRVGGGRDFGGGVDRCSRFSRGLGLGLKEGFGCYLRFRGFSSNMRSKFKMSINIQKFNSNDWYV
jgi:hypothetical protein